MLRYCFGITSLSTRGICPGGVFYQARSIFVIVRLLCRLDEAASLDFPLAAGVESLVRVEHRFLRVGACFRCGNSCGLCMSKTAHGVYRARFVVEEIVGLQKRLHGGSGPAEISAAIQRLRLHNRAGVALGLCDGEAAILRREKVDGNVWIVK